MAGASDGLRPGRLADLCCYPEFGPPVESVYRAVVLSHLHMASYRSVDDSVYARYESMAFRLVKSSDWA